LIIWIQAKKCGKCLKDYRCNLKEMLFNPNRVARGVWHVKNFRDIKFVDDFKKPNLPFYFIPREKLV